MTTHNKINYETSCIGRFSEKHRYVSSTIATAKMELSMALVVSFQTLTNFTKNTNIAATGVLNSPLEYYKAF